MKQPRSRTARSWSGALVALVVALAVVVLPGAQPSLAAPRVLPAATTTHGFVLSDYESALLDGINAQRAANGLPGFRLSGGATDVARRWARQLAANGSLSHDPNLGSDMDANGSAGWTTVGENVASGGTAPAVVTAWMNSPGHRANILNPRFTVIGMGAVVSGGRTWSSTEFADVADGRAPTTSPDTTGEAPAAPPASSTRIASLSSSGVLDVKEGGLYSSWTTLTSGVTSYGLDGVRVGAVTSDGLARVKEGALSNGWTTLADRTRGIALSGGRVAVLGADGSVRVKEGSISAGWTTLWGAGATGVVLDGNRIAVLAGGTAYVKEGSVYSGWVTVANGVSDLALSGGRLAAVVGGTAWAKDGSLYSGWVALSSADRVVLAGDRIGVLSGRAALVKDGLYSAWTTVADRSVTALTVSTSRIAVVDSGTVRVKEGAVYAPWVDVSSGAQVALSR